MGKRTIEIQNDYVREEDQNKIDFGIIRKYLDEWEFNKFLKLYHLKEEEIVKMLTNHKNDEINSISVDKRDDFCIYQVSKIIKTTDKIIKITIITFAKKGNNLKRFNIEVKEI